MTRCSNRLLPTPIVILLTLLLFLPAALGQEVDWDISSRVASSAGDSEEFLANSLDDPQRWPAGFSYAESSDLELGRDATHSAQIVGLRFENLQIPPGARIESAVIEFTADSDQSAPLSLTIRAQDATETEPFIQDQDGQGSFDLSSRPATDAAAPWTPGAWTEGQIYNSTDIAAIVQAVVDREGWQPGSSIVLLIGQNPAGGDGFRSAHAFDSDPQRAPRLLVSLSEGDAAGEAPVEPSVEGAGAEPGDAAAEPVGEGAEPGDAAAEPSDEAAEPGDAPAAAEEPAQAVTPEVEVEPVDPDPIIPAAPSGDAPSVWQGPSAGPGQAIAQPQGARNPPESAGAPVSIDEPRRQRYPLTPNFGGGLEGSVLLSDYGGGVTVVTVFLANPDEEVTYAASIRRGVCGAGGPLIVDLQPIPGDKAFSTSLLSLGFDELTGGSYNLTIYRTAADFIRVAACAALAGV